MKGTDVSFEQLDHADRFLRQVEVNGSVAYAADGSAQLMVGLKDLIRLLAWYGAIRAKSGSAIPRPLAHHATGLTADFQQYESMTEEQIESEVMQIDKSNRTPGTAVPEYDPAARGRGSASGPNKATLRTEQELRRLIADYGRHEHSYEDGECSVCCDMDQLEHELAMVTGDWSKWGHPPTPERECTCKSNDSVPAGFHGINCPLFRDAGWREACDFSTEGHKAFDIAARLFADLFPDITKRMGIDGSDDKMTRIFEALDEAYRMGQAK